MLTFFSNRAITPLPVGIFQFSQQLYEKVLIRRKNTPQASKANSDGKVSKFYVNDISKNAVKWTSFRSNGLRLNGVRSNGWNLENIPDGTKIVDHSYLMSNKLTH